MDDYDTAKYGHTAYCPYDATDPPTTRHSVSGSISVTALLTSTNTALITGINALTSDGPGNCLVGGYSHNGTAYQKNYACDVFDWGAGWNGYIQATYDASSMKCTPNRITGTNITANSTGNSFSNCTLGSYVSITGTVTSSGNRSLSSAVLSGGGECTVDAGGLSYSCLSAEITDPTWSGTLTVTATGGRLCPESGTSRVFTYTDIISGNYTQNLTIGQNANACIGVP